MFDCFRFLKKNRNTAGLASLRARIKFIFVILVIVCTLIGMSPSSVLAAGTTYYVNNTVACSDSGSGTSGSPFCTIAKGASMTVPGDTVQVVAGTYAETVLPKSGSAGSPVTITAAPGVTVTGAPGATSSGGAFRLSTKSYVVIDGFMISHTADSGITVDSSNNITISDNHISYSGSPVSGSNRYGIDIANTTNSIFTGNTLDHNSYHGILLSGGSTNNEISDNIAFANAEEWQRNANGIRLDGSTNNTIQHNILYANEDSGLQFYTGSSNNSVIENLAYGNGDHGIDNNASPNNKIIGNTVQGNVTSGINLEGAAAPGSGGATVANNIMVDNGFLRQVGGGTASGQPSNFRADNNSLSGTTLDYNLYYLSSGTDQITWDGSTYAALSDFHTAQPTQEVHGLQANPLFVSPAPVAQRPAAAPFNVAVNSGNYHLSFGSQAIDSANSGAPGEPTTDIEGNTRADDPDSANTGAGTRTYDDRGVYEYQPVAKVLPTVTTQAVSSIGSTTATGNGNITALGVPNPTQHGVVWSTAANPTTANSKTSDGSVSGTGAFTSAMTGLTPGTSYHVRAYAINAAGTSYGGDVGFTTLPTSTSITTPATNAGMGADGGGTGSSWTNPGSITADDTNYATYNVGTNGTSHYLNGTNYGFNIPASATIRGIQVSIGRFADSNRIQDETVQLIKAGTRAGSNLSAGSTWPTSMAAANYGSTSNLWGTTWVPADINASNFGVSLRVANSSGSLNHTPSVDYIQISVTYSVSSVGSSTTVNCGAGTPVVTYGSTIICVATVAAGSGTNSPTGNVSWTAGVNGTFVTTPCSLSGSGGTATCSVTYRPSLVGTGSHSVTANYAGDGSFLSSTGNQIVTVNSLALIPGITASNKIYDATTTAAILTRTLTGVVGTDVVSLIGGTATFDTKNVGTGKTVTAIGLSLSGTNAGNYTVNPSATTLADITPKALTVTATGVNRPYNGTLVATVTLSTDALVGDTVAPAYTSAAFATKDVANGIAVSVTGISISGLDAVNYTLINTTAATTANITPMAITGNITASDKAYDGNTSATILTRTLTGVVGTDVVNYIGGTATFNTKNVGTAKAVTATGLSLSGAAAGNYTVNATANTTASITPIAITGNITASNKIYNGNTSATIATRILTGVIGTDVVNYTGGTATFDTKNVGTGKTVTATGLGLSGADAVNYTVNPGATTIADITPKGLTVTATGVNRPYDGTLVATVTLSTDALVGDTVTPAYTAASFTTTDIGSGKAVSVTGILLGGLDVSNYYLLNTTAATTANITPLTLTGNITASDKVYDFNTNATILARTLTGVVGTDVVNYIGGTATFNTKNVGTGKTVTAVGLSLSGAGASNYTVNTTATTTANITPTAITGNITASNKVYDGNTSATITTRTMTGVIGTDVVNYTGGTATFNTKNVGTGKTVTATGLGLSGTDGGNYTVNTTASTTANITPKDLTVTATGINKPYDGTVNATVTLSTDAVVGDIVTPTYTSAVFDNKNVGTGKLVTVTGISISGADFGNYHLLNTSATTTANIMDKPLATTLVTPTGDIGTNYNPTYTWNDRADSTWYQLSVDGPSGNVFLQWYTSAQANCNGSTCSVTPATTLTGGKAYSWKIKTWNPVGEGPWSSAMSFSTTVAGVPGAATLVTPTGDIGTNYNPTYTWNPVTGSIWYQFSVDGPSGNVFLQWYTSAQANCNSSTCSVTPAATLAGGAYTWKVQTWSPAGNGPWSSPMSFNTTVVGLPGAATLVTPTDNIGTNYNPTYTWNQVTGSTWYQFSVDGPSGNVILQWYTSAQANCNGSTCSVTPATTLAGGTAYTWKVQTWNSAGIGPWSSPMSFNTTLPSLPGAATLVTPTGNIGTNYNPTYTWNQVTDSTWYQFSVDGPSGNVFLQWYTSAQAACTGTTCSVTPATTLAGGVYTWKVQTWSPAGNGPWSTPMSFSTIVASLPGAATLVTPTGSIGTNHNPTYTWNQVTDSTWYYLWVNGPSGTLIQQWYTSAQANCNGTTCSVTPATTLAGGAYTWWIQTWNIAGTGPWSTAMPFTVSP